MPFSGSTKRFSDYVLEPAIGMPESWKSELESIRKKILDATRERPGEADRVKSREVVLILNLILITSLAVITTSFGEIPFHDPWFLVAIWLMFYHNQIGALVRGMPAPTPQSSDWYRWIYGALHEALRKEERSDPSTHRRDMLETIELVNELSEKKEGKR